MAVMLGDRESCLRCVRLQKLQHPDKTGKQKRLHALIVFANEVNRSRDRFACSVTHWGDMTGFRCHVTQGRGSCMTNGASRVN